MALFLEDTKEVTKKQISIPQNAKKVFQSIKKVYEPYLNKPIKGAKIIKSLASDTSYNTKDKNTNGNEIKQKKIPFDVAKKRLERQSQLPRNSIEYQLYGGDLAYNINKKGIESARNVQSVDKVKPPMPTAKNATKPKEIAPKEIQKPNGKITYNESRRILREYNDDYNLFFDYMEDYDISYVLNQFAKNPKGQEDWGVLINPEMYAKALREFSRYGKLIAFPTKYVYQWMGIIMKNTAILYANTILAGHHQYFDEDGVIDFFTSFFENKREVEFIKDSKIKIEIFVNDLPQLCEGEFSLMNENTDKYGQTYFPWMTKGDIERYVSQQDTERKMAKFEKTYGDYMKYIEDFNSQSPYQDRKIEFDDKTKKMYLIIDCFEFLSLIGIYEWMRMPDGSDAWSDYGLEPLFKILREYNEELTPEKTLVLVNRALDVGHQRGDMASIFIQGGNRSLSKISENVNRKNIKKIYLSEAALLKIKSK